MLGVDKVASPVRLLVGLLVLAVLVPIALLILIPLLPWRWTRLRISNHLGTCLGWTIMKVSGCPLELVGREAISSERRALYVGNHTSIYDTFLSIWLAPTGTVGVAKKQIIYYPFFGLAWLLSGNLSIDRSNPERAIASLEDLARVVDENRLSIFMWPEGHRSKDGRLLPFKKGAAYLALRTRLPIIPVVIEGAHRAWPKGSLALTPARIRVTFLPAIDTAEWTEDHLARHLEEVREAFIGALPPEQRPLELGMGPA